MKRIEVAQSGKGMKNGLILWDDNENLVMLHFVREIASADLDHA